MPTQEWTQLVQQVDRLISALRQSRAEARRWRSRAAELEGTQVTDARGGRLAEQAKDRELERMRKERRRILAVVERMLAEVEQVQRHVTDGGGS